MRVSRTKAIVACALCALLGMAIAGSSATAQTTTQPSSPVATASSLAKTALQCKHKYHSTHGLSLCFSQLPGANCAHPLEAEKAHATTRGEHQYFKLDYTGKKEGNGVSEHYSYKVAGKNLAMCPHGAVFTVSRLSQESVCRHFKRQGHIVLECSSEYAPENFNEPVNAHGGSFDYYLPNEPTKVAHLVVKARFVHPPWMSHK